MITLKKKNELYIEIRCEKNIQYEIYDKFSFQVPGYKFMPRYKSGMWDGTVKLYNLKQNNFPIGLLSDFLRMAKTNGWKVSIDPALKLISFEHELEQFLENTLPSLLLDPYDYQLSTFIKSISLNRSLVLSPTRKW